MKRTLRPRELALLLPAVRFRHLDNDFASPDIIPFPNGGTVGDDEWLVTLRWRS